MEQRVESSDAGGPLAELGNDFRREREARGVTHQEIADATKISSRFLEAIERGDAAALPAPVFTRGFIKEYAQYLGLDQEGMVERYMAQVQLDEEREARSEAELQERIRGKLPLIPGASVLKWLVILIIVAAVIGGAVWMFAGSDAGEPEPAEAPPVAGEPAPEPEPAEPEPVVSNVEVTAKASEPTWMLVSVDGNAAEEMTLDVGDSRTFTGNQTVTFERIGNAGGIDVTLNGVPLTKLGSSGQIVRNVTYDLDAARRAVEKERGTSPSNE